MVIDVGQVVAKKYELVRLLGRGSMGEVWSAHHQALGEQCALKVLTWPAKGEDSEEPAVALARFRFEAQVAARLSRKTRHIARVTDYGEDDGLPYLVMELLDGETLDAALRLHGRLPLGDATQIVSQIARALDQAHAEAVAHRDLKPANVFLTRDEEGRLLVKLLDFGIARTIHAHRMQGTYSTAKGFVFGTPGYMSPEQTRASPKLDHRCDLWALATIAYQTLSGHLPVEGVDADEIMKNLCAGRIVPLRQRDPTLPGTLAAFFEQAFADRVDDRFQSASELAQAFEIACFPTVAIVPNPIPSAPDSVSTGTEFSATVARDALRVGGDSRAKVALAFGGVLLAVVVTVGGIWRTFTSPPPQVRATATATGAPPSESVARPAGPEPTESAITSGWSAASTTPVVTPPASTASPAAAPTQRAGEPRASSAIAQPPRPKAADPAPPRPIKASARPPEDRNDVF